MGKITHGGSALPVYHVWHAILKRCGRPGDKGYRNYGGRGIKVCQRWLKFENFIEDMGYPFPGQTLDRIDNDGGYSPENCRWVSHRKNCRNKRNNRLLTIDGETKCLADWADISGVPRGTIETRLSRGKLTVKDSVFKSVRTSEKLLTVNGHTKRLSEWASLLGVPWHLINSRLRYGWDVEKAIFLPSSRPRKKDKK